MIQKTAGLLIVAIAFACNNSNTQTQPPHGVQVNHSGSKETDGCGKLILFKPGAMIESKNYDASGKETSEQTTTIAGVHDSSGISVAEADIRMQLPGGKISERHLRYMCDGSGLYMDLNDLLSNISSARVITASEKGMKFPINLKEGMDLPESSVSLEMGRGGISMQTTVSYKNRKVERKESIGTAGGSWSAFKITSDIVTETQMKGADEHQQKLAEMMKKNKPVQRSIIWFSPEAGLVRMEMYNGDVLLSRTDIVSIK